MSSSQLALCARVVRTGDIVPALGFGITLEDFTTAEARRIWALILDYYTKPETRGSVISETMMMSWFGDVRLVDDRPGSTTDALCHEVRKERAYSQATTAAQQFISAAEDRANDPIPKLTKLHQEITQIIARGTTKSSDMSLGKGVDNLRNKLLIAATGVSTAVMPWCWDALENVTFGLQPDDYVVLYGRPKSMKSWVLCYLVA